MKHCNSFKRIIIKTNLKCSLSRWPDFNYLYKLAHISIRSHDMVLTVDRRRYPSLHAVVQYMIKRPQPQKMEGLILFGYRLGLCIHILLVYVRSLQFIGLYVYKVLIFSSAVTVSPLLTTVGYGRFFEQISRLRSAYGFSNHCTRNVRHRPILSDSACVTTECDTQQLIELRKRKYISDISRQTVEAYIYIVYKICQQSWEIHIYT
jgi:hypothetical protein